MRRRRTISLAGRVRIRVAELRSRNRRTSAGEPMSLAAIGRTLSPPVHRVSLYQVVAGRSRSRRIEEALERELGIRVRARGQRTDGRG